MPKYTVYLLAPYVSWEGVEADNEEDAIDQCDPIVWPDSDDGPCQFLAIEEFLTEEE